MDYKTLASQIVERIGGVDNVVRVTHCSTRLRFDLADNSKADVEGLKKVKGVMGVVVAAQLQIIIGNNVNEAYDALIAAYDFGGTANLKAAAAPKQSIGATFLQYLIGIFQPLIAVLAGAGVLKSMLLLLNLVGILDKESMTYALFVNISDAAFYFLPIMVAVSTADIFKCHRLVAAASVGYLLLPATTELLANGAELFGFSIQAIAYNAQVFPAILSTIFLAQVEHFFEKISPKPIRTFFVPMMSFAITVPITLLILGPLGYNLGQGLTAVILFMYDTFGWAAVAGLAAILPFMIAMGMHKALVPHALNSLATVGYETLYLTASLAHNLSEAGACFGVAVRTKDSELRQTALSAGVSAFVGGITEPALYGVTLTHRRAMIGVVLSSAITGAAIGIFGIKAFVSAAASLAAITMYVDEANPMNLVYAAICLVMAVVISFIIVVVIWKDETVTDGAEEPVKAVSDDSTDGIPAISGASSDEFVAPVSGQAVALSDVADEVFASGTLGDGLAIRPNEGTLYAPVDAEVAMLFETGHAIGLKLADGCELLMHIGIDTVRMEGKGFKTLVKTGDRVKAGQALIEFDIPAIEQAGYDPTVSIVVSTPEFSVSEQACGSIASGEPLFKAEKVAKAA